MDKSDFARAVQILRNRQIMFNTTANNEAVEDTFIQSKKLMLSLGQRSEGDVEKSEKYYRQEFLKYPLLTEYENTYCNWILNDILNILYEARKHIKCDDEGVSLDFELPIIGSVNFGFYDARAVNDDGAKVVLISRSLLTFTACLATIVAQSSLNQSHGLSNEYINQYFVDISTAFHLFYPYLGRVFYRERERDVANISKRCPITDWTACLMGEQLSVTSHLFVVAHEYSHLILNHPFKKISVEKCREDEQEADELAGLLCGIIISILKKDKYPFSFIGLAFAVRTLDLIHDIMSIFREKKWDPNVDIYPLNRTSVVADVMQRFKVYDKNTIEITKFMLYDINRLWLENENQIKYFINKYENGLSYEEIQKLIYE